MNFFRPDRKGYIKGKTAAFFSARRRVLRIFRVNHDFKLIFIPPVAGKGIFHRLLRLIVSDGSKKLYRLSCRKSKIPAVLLCGSDSLHQTFYMVDARGHVLPKNRIQGSFGKVMAFEIRACVAGEEGLNYNDGFIVGKAQAVEKKFLSPFWNPIAVDVGRKVLGIKPII